MKAPAVVRYGFVSATCLLLHNLCLIVADFYGYPLSVSICISYVIVVVTGYVMHSIISFRRPLALMEFGRYALAMSANMPFAWVTTWFWHGPVGFSMIYAAPLASGSMVVANFLLSHWAIAGRTPASGMPTRFDR
jgi:putative flippase GtrA